MKTERLEIHAADCEEMERFIASISVLKKCGFIPTGTLGEEGPGFVYTGENK